MKHYLITGLLILSTAACSPMKQVEVVELLNHSSCQNLKAGISETTLAKVGTLRQSRLLPPPDDAPVQPEQQLPELEATRVFAISKGSQPTPGYAFSHEETVLDGDRVRVRLAWETPAAGAVLPQMLTHPCIVLGVPETGAKVLVAEDQGGAFAELPL